MDFLVLSAILFFMSLLIIELSRYAYRNLESTRKSKIKKRLRKYVLVENDFGDILKQRNLSDIPLLNKILISLPVVAKLDRLVLQAHAKQPLSVYVMLSLLLGFVGSTGTMVYTNNGLYALLAGAALFFSPYLYLINLKTKRTQKFETQLHEALDLVARALKAGHSFTASMQLAAEEFADPLGTEFEETLDEINFGVSVPAALKSLAERVDCTEVKYFVMAVIIQRDSGGNLAELIESLAHIVRERFRFDGKVRVLSAEGKMSAVILVLLPILMAAYLQITNHEYLLPLIQEPIGRIMALTAVVMMIIGAVVINRMVQIEV